MDSLQDLVFKYEQPNSSYQLSKVDPKYIQGLSKGIVGFKISMNHIVGKAKLSQNHTLERQSLVVEHLEQLAGENEHKIAKLMKKNLSNHKPSS